MTLNIRYKICTWKRFLYASKRIKKIIVFDESTYNDRSILLAPTRVASKNVHISRRLHFFIYRLSTSYIVVFQVTPITTSSRSFYLKRSCPLSKLVWLFNLLPTAALISMNSPRWKSILESKRFLKPRDPACDRDLGRKVSVNCQLIVSASYY